MSNSLCCSVCKVRKKELRAALLVVVLMMASPLLPASVSALDLFGETKLTASDGAADDWFGDSVAVSGGRAVVGADGDDDHGEYSGSAYVFTESLNPIPTLSQGGVISFGMLLLTTMAWALWRRRVA